MQRYLGLSEEEIAQNQKMWAEEHGESKDDAVKGNDLRNVGVTGGGISSDMSDQTEPQDDADIEAPDTDDAGAGTGDAPPEE